MVDQSEMAMLEARVKALEAKVMQLEARMTAVQTELSKDEALAEKFEQNPLGSLL
jgi:hypothetical protein